jgi:uncharacterized membrane protein YdjX (TVP38/TMEM64 family)
MEPTPKTRATRDALIIATSIAVLLAALFAWDGEAMSAFRQEAGPVPFLAAMALLPALGVPITPLFLLAGATFGRTLGLVLSWVALGANLALCYFIASALRPRLASLVRRFGHALPDFGESRRGAVRFTLAVKATPGVPAFMKNYGLGVAGVSFPTYFALSMLITGAYAAALVLVGESLLQHDLGRTGVVLAVLTVCALALLRFRRAHRVRQVPTA